MAKGIPEIKFQYFMLELINHSSYISGLYTGTNQNNNPQLTCVIKAAWQFNLEGKLKLQKSATIEEIDRYLGEPGKSSLMAASEIMPFKERTEILLYSSTQLPQKSLNQVSLKIEWPDGKTWQKTLQNSLIRFKSSQKKITDFGPLSANSQRSVNVTTNRAAQDQQFNQPFIGGEKIFLRGLIPDIPVTQTIKILLPTLKPNLKLFLNDQPQILTPTCDTIIINTDKMTLDMLWRMGIHWGAENDRDGVLLLG